jgi:hypothetical protein
MLDQESLRRINERYPWPENRPPVPSVRWAMDYGGRRLITNLIASRDVRVMLEIGSFLGGSARQWLEASSNVSVICVDPWLDISGPRPFIDSHPMGCLFGQQLRCPEGFYHTFLSSMWDLKARVTVIRGKATDKLPELHELGLKPDLIYIDADKRGEEIAVCDALFPDALIGGDDWNWSDGYCFPIRSPARKSARNRGRVLKHFGNTWLIDNRTWSMRERSAQLRETPFSAAQTLRAFFQRGLGKTSVGTARKACSRGKGL